MTTTPMQRQYESIKARHRDCILFFRLGDFYEMFGDDAREAAGVLDLVLTARHKGTGHETAMCGIPYHAADGYIARLIKAGRKVAICEQVEDPGAAKGIVKRDVIRVITSGTYLDENTTDARYLLCLAPGAKPGDPSGMAFIDPASGTIRADQYADGARVAELIGRLPVCECVYPSGGEETVRQVFRHPALAARGIALSPHEDWCFNPEIARKNLCEHFGLPNLRGYGVEDLPAAAAAAGALLEYLRQMNRQPLRHIDRIALYADDDYLFISPAAVSGLELDKLARHLTRTRCAMGKRLLHHWLFHPLKHPRTILQRQAAVTILREEAAVRESLGELLRAMPDAEKHVSRLSCGYLQARDVLAVRHALALIPDLKSALDGLAKRNRLFTLDDLPDLRGELEAAVNPDMPLAKPEGKIVRPGFHTGLDELRAAQENGRQWLRDFQAREIKRTGINSLKVGFNKVFGYYIEISKANLKHAPQDYIRKQTLVNGERYITPELKEYEEKILTAQERIAKIENEILDGLCRKILDAAAALHEFFRQAATVDALNSLAAFSLETKMTAPQINDSTLIDIREGRHPVVEAAVDDFVANDIRLDGDEQHLIILTGPNMAGKSTYIRQTAVLVILAQMGGYIPAAAAVIGAADKIFTRIGAHDDIAKGQSTFMVEMNEMADIVNNLTPRSLVVLDEIGRGTSTFDGLSLAWALAEHLKDAKARTLFATHFHELTALAEEHSGVTNCNVAVKEWKDEIVFLHKIVPGSTDDSYGIYVAKLAGVPPGIIRRARTILTQLEVKGDLKEHLRRHGGGEQQLGLFDRAPADDSLRKEIEALDVNAMTPLQALNTLQRLKENLKSHEL